MNEMNEMMLMGDQQNQISQLAQTIGNQIASSIATQIASAINNAMSGFQTDVNGLKAGVNDLKRSTNAKFENIENNYSLAPDQILILDREITARASRLLNIRWIHGRCADECIGVKKRYFGKLRSSMIREMKTALGIAQSTQWKYMPRKYFNDARDFVRSYDPIGGIEEFKAYVDKSNAA